MRTSEDSEVAAIFWAVGRSLTYWEEMDDFLFDCFVGVCGVFEPTAVEFYLKADRQKRFNLLKSAGARYSREIGEEKVQELLALAVRSNELAKMRNEIAHGRCTRIKNTVDNDVVRNGVFLVPGRGYPWSDGPLEYKYYHTESDILEFIEKVRDVRWSLHQIYSDLMISERFREGVRAQSNANRLFKRDF